MGIFKYKIYFKYLEEGQEPITIPYDNLTSMVIDYDYKSETHFPIVMAIFDMDKNLIDKIIEHKDTAKIMFSIKKVNERNDAPLEESYITDAECYYTIQDDVNKEQKRDYEEKTPDGGEKKDIYKQVTIGLSGVKFVEDNVKSTNLTVKETNMIGVVHELTKHMSMVIEPFKYNEDIPQLLIPPQESINEAIAFLNNMKVFYDTPYRFYMEFDRSFLVSSSATPVPIKGEKYATVIIDVRDEKDKSRHDAYEQGISEDDEAQAYMIGIMKENTNFVQDNTTSKDFNKLVGILDPSKKNSIPNLTNGFLSNITNMMNTMRDTVNNSVNSVTQGINDAVSGFNKMNYELKEIVEEEVQSFQNTVQEATSYVDSLVSQVHQVAQALQQAGQQASQGDIGGAIDTTINPIAELAANFDEEGITKKLRDFQEQLRQTGPESQGCFGDLGKGVETFGEYSNKACDTGYNVTNINGSINGIKIQNAADNINHMTKDYDEKNKKDIKDMTDTCNKCNDEITTSSQGIDKSMNNATDALEGIKTEMKKVEEAANAANSASSGGGEGGGSSSDSGGSEPIEVDYSKLDEYKGNINTNQSVCAPAFQDMLGRCQKALDTTALMGRVNDKVTNKVNEMKDMKGKLESQFKDISNSWREAATNLQTQVKQMEAMSSLGISSISQLSDLNSIADLSSVAKLGVTSISTPQLNIMTTGSEKVKFVKLGNDDPNKIKNIQAEIEMMGTMFTITKEHMDNSLLTINKKYLVQNKGQHSEENGKYLLIRKREVYMKEDQKFSTTTMLSFCRVGES